MKKIIIYIMTFAIFCISGISAIATGIWGSVCVFDEHGNQQYGENLEIAIGFLEESEYRLSAYGNSKLWRELDDETKSLICSNAEDEEYFTIFELKYGNINNIEETGVFKVSLNTTFTCGGSKRNELMGTDYRAYYLSGDALEEIEIKRSDEDSVTIETDKTGVYILYYNPNIYDVKFYDEYPEDTEEAFYVIDGLGKYDIIDIIDFPEIPQKDGYVFTGWKHDYWKGMYTKHSYIEPSEFTPLDLWKVYASWCPEEEYTPLEVTIDSEKITKGKENGCEIILTLSEGRFDDVIDENIENDWKVVGNDEILISNVERIDDKTAKLTLSGNSSDKYKSGEIQVEFNSELYISEEDYNGTMSVNEIADVQLDEKGVKKAMFTSDNSITLNEVESDLSIIELSENCVEVETLEESGVVILAVYNSEGIIDEVITKKAEKRVVFDDVDLCGDTIALMQWNGIDTMESVTEKVTAKICE